MEEFIIQTSIYNDIIKLNVSLIMLTSNNMILIYHAWFITIKTTTKLT